MFLLGGFLTCRSLWKTLGVWYATTSHSCPIPSLGDLRPPQLRSLAYVVTGFLFTILFILLRWEHAPLSTSHFRDMFHSGVPGKLGRQPRRERNHKEPQSCPKRGRSPDYQSFTFSNFIPRYPQEISRNHPHNPLQTGWFLVISCNIPKSWWI